MGMKIYKNPSTEIEHFIHWIFLCMTKRIFHIIGICIIFTIVGIGLNVVHGQERAFAQWFTRPVVEWKLIAKFKSSELNLEKKSGLKSLSTLQDTQDFSTQEILPSQNIVLIQIPSDETLATEIQTLQDDPNVEYVQPDFLYTTSSLPNDPSFNKQRWLNNTGQFIDGTIWTPGADIDRSNAMNVRSWTNDISVSGTLVAVIDIWVDYRHPDLIDQMRDGTNCLSETWAALGGCLYGYNFWDNNFDPIAVGNAHGTHVAGIIWAENGNALGVVGINPHTKIMAIRAGSGNSLDTLSIIKWISFAKYNGAKIINASWWDGENDCDDAFDIWLYDAIRDFPGLLVAAAGNDGREHKNNYYVAPADYAVTTSCWTGLANIIGVAATDQNDQLASFSDYGVGRIAVAAPGVNIYSTVLNSGYDFADGTSMATPFVVGVASLARSMLPQLSVTQLIQALTMTWDVIPGLMSKVAGGHRLNAYMTLQYIRALQNIAGLQAYVNSWKILLLSSGWYTSGTSIYLEWNPSAFSGNVQSYHYQLLSSGSLWQTGSTNMTGITLPLNGEGNYEYDVREVFSGTNWTGDFLSTLFSVDTTPPSQANVLSPISGAWITSWNKIFSRSAAYDTGAGMTGGSYFYEIFLSGNAIPSMTGVSATTWIIIPQSMANGRYLWHIKACDSVNICGNFSDTGAFAINSTPVFSFTAQTNKEISTLSLSDEITIGGLITGAQVSIVGWTYSVNWSGFTWSNGIVYSGDKIEVQLTSSSAYSTTVSAALVVGDFTWIFNVTTKAASNPNPVTPGGGDVTPSCLLTDLICIDGHYQIKPGVFCQWGNNGKSCNLVQTWSVTWTNSTGTLHIITFQTWTISAFSPELIQAYNYAYGIGITTIPHIEDANLTWTLIRSHLAKMISNFAIHVLDQKPNTSMVCDFTDMGNETAEMQLYAKVACQLGLMWLDAQWQATNIFHPDQSVTRAQFWTVLSRALRWDRYNGGEPFYSMHLSALQQADIMKNISQPWNAELRGYVMLMLMRSADF